MGNRPIMEVTTQLEGNSMAFPTHHVSLCHGPWIKSLGNGVTHNSVRKAHFVTFCGLCLDFISES